MSADSLAVSERAKLVDLETIIERNIHGFYETGNALTQIRDERLYRADHKTFEEYCREKWGLSRVHAHRLMEASSITTNLLPMGNILPQSERQARPLTRIAPDKQREVWQEAVKTAPGGKVTAKHVQEVVTKTKPVFQPRMVSDAMGFAVIAISQLKRIQPEDPGRKEAMDTVALWIEKHK